MSCTAAASMSFKPLYVIVVHKLLQKTIILKTAWVFVRVYVFLLTED